MGPPQNKNHTPFTAPCLLCAWVRIAHLNVYHTTKAFALFFELGEAGHTQKGYTKHQETAYVYAYI